jgi:hypothetical protein
LVKQNLRDRSEAFSTPPSHIKIISNMLEEKGLCERGLEEDIDDELRYSIGRRMRRSIAIVLDEQQCQRRLLLQQQQQPSATGRVSPLDVIARLYREATRVAQWDALERGRQDAQVANVTSLLPRHDDDDDDDTEKWLAFLARNEKEKKDRLDQSWRASATAVRPSE